MSNIWDTRYSSEEYAYGTEPNEYFRKEINNLKPGSILLPGEGEGRNALFAAKLGWSVLAVDSSVEGRRKALELAVKHKVQIEYLTEDILRFEPDKNVFDLISLIYVHLPSSERNTVHRKMADSLKEGGVMLIEAFSKKQLANNSGGPKDADMLYSVEELRDDFGSLKILELSECEVELDEGNYHKGKAFVVRMKAVK